MTEMLIFLPFMCVGLLCITWVKSGSLFNPVGIIAVVWLSLLWLSNFSLSGIFVPSPISQSIFIVAIFSMVMGSLLARNLSHVPVISIKHYDKNKSYIFVLLLFIASPIIFFICFGAFKVILSEGFKTYIWLTRSAHGEGRSVIFGEGYLRIFVNFFVLPIIYSGVFIGVSAFVLFNQKAIFFISSGLMLLYTIVMSARDGILLIIILLSYCFILTSATNSKNSLPSFRQFRLCGYFVLVVLIFLVFLISIYRGRSDYSILDLLMHYFVTYHTLGFTMFDLAFHDRDSIMNIMTTWGRALFGFPDEVLEIFSRRIDDEGLRSISRELRAVFGERIVVGYQKSEVGVVIMANAFYTVMYILYLDFGFLGIIFIPMIYGFITMNYFLAWKHNVNNYYALSMTLMFVWVGYSSLFMPVVISSFFWPFIILLWSYFRVKLPGVRLK